MLIFVYEYTCASCSWPSLPPSLRAEGLAMLAAVVEDFRCVPGVETVALVAPDFPHRLPGQCHSVGADERADFLDCARRADWTLVIAPEFDGLLAARCRWVAEAGGRSLNCAPEAIELTGDKLALAGHWQSRGVPTPLTAAAGVANGWAPPDFPAVLKPRYGAGSMATFRIDNSSELMGAVRAAASEAGPQPLILQRFLPGRPVSAAFLVGPGRCVPLPPAAQRLSDDGRFRYLGGSVPLPPELARRATDLAGRAMATVPGRCGYVGVDLVLGAADDGSGDAVIEINPRLTTSYIGLRRLAKGNLAAALLDVGAGEAVSLGWHGGPVEFRADGSAAG